MKFLIPNLLYIRFLVNCGVWKRSLSVNVKKVLWGIPLAICLCTRSVNLWDDWVNCYYQPPWEGKLSLQIALGEWFASADHLALLAQIAYPFWTVNWFCMLNLTSNTQARVSLSGRNVMTRMGTGPYFTVPPMTSRRIRNHSWCLNPVNAVIFPKRGCEIA